MIFRRNRAEYSDGIIDLIPIHFTPPDPAMGFGREQVWRITLHDHKGEIGQISYRNGESRCIYYFGHIGYHIDEPYRGHHYATGPAFFWNMKSGSAENPLSSLPVIRTTNQAAEPVSAWDAFSKE